MPRTDSGVGWQRTDTSRMAAEAIAPVTGTIKERVLACLHNSVFPLTSEEIARALDLPYGSVQPRLSELQDDKRVKDSGLRKTGRFGKQIIAWSLA